MTRSTTTLDIYVGAQIAARRVALGLSQTTLAQSIGVTFQQVQKYEGGSNRVSASRLHAIAMALAVPITAFFPPTRSLDDPGSDRDADRSQDTEFRLMLGLAEGQAVMKAFPAIADAMTRKAVARIVQALAVTA